MILIVAGRPEQARPTRRMIYNARDMRKTAGPSRCALGFWALAVLTACGQAGSPPLEMPQPVLRQLTRTVDPAPTMPLSPLSPTEAATARPALIDVGDERPPDTPSSTPDPFSGLTLFDLVSRQYGGSALQVYDELPTPPGASFSRYLFSYSSDELSIYGFVNLPDGTGPFPVIIALHGYVDPDEYQTLDYTTRYADALAEAGYLVLHPNLRGYPPSDWGPNPFRVGMAIDVLNLIAIVEQQAGRPGPLAGADGDRIGLWGHSMGGGIALRVLTVSRSVDAAVLYGSMSADEARNWNSIFEWSEGARGGWEVSVPLDELVRISPKYFLHWIDAPLSIHHGEADQLVPPAWSTELCEMLSALQKEHECFTYPGQPHTFFGDQDRLLMTRSAAFYDRYLQAPLAGSVRP